MALQYLNNNLPQSQVLANAIEVIDVEICKVLARKVLEAEFGVPTVAEEDIVDVKDNNE